MLAMRSVSGPLPDHEDLYKYTEPHQERIFRIAEAWSTDESKRRDKVVDAQITTSKRSQWITPALLILFGGAAFYFFGVGNNIAGGLLLGIPVLRFLGTFVSAFAVRRSREDDDDNED